MSDTQQTAQNEQSGSQAQGAPDPMATRRAALQILTTILDKSQPLDQALENSNAFLSLPEARDRAFVLAEISPPPLVGSQFVLLSPKLQKDNHHKRTRPPVQCDPC